jgi:hypothetical protein
VAQVPVRRGPDPSHLEAVERGEIVDVMNFTELILEDVAEALELALFGVVDKVGVIVGVMIGGVMSLVVGLGEGDGVVGGGLREGDGVVGLGEGVGVV